MLLYMTGFDYMPEDPTEADLQRILGYEGWAFRGVTGNDYWMTTPGRFNYGRCLSIDGGASTSGISMAFETEHNRLVWGFALRTPLQDDPPIQCRFGFVDNNGTRWFFEWEESGYISLYQWPDPGSPGRISRSLPGRYIPGSWHYAEVKADIAIGMMEVRINGQSALFAMPPFPGTTTGLAAVWNWMDVALNGHIDVDDMYILNGSGTDNTDYLGTCRVQWQDQVAPGDLTEWTPSDGGPNWNTTLNLNVDDTQYVSSNVTGTEDLYDLDVIINAASIYGVCVKVAARDVDAAGREVAGLIKSGGVIDEGASFSLDATFTAKPGIFERDPATSAGWTNAAVNALQAGMKLTT